MKPKTSVAALDSQREMKWKQEHTDIYMTDSNWRLYSKHRKHLYSHTSITL